MNNIQQIKKSIKKSAARLEIIRPFNKLFKKIEFESLSYCNRKCSYCPNADWERFGDDNEFFMKEDVFINLIDQLAEAKFVGQISPHLYGEPMADPRIIDWMAHIRKKLPRSNIKIVTSGDYLNRNNFLELIEAGVDLIFISKHSKKLKKNCIKLLENLEIKYQKHIVFHDFHQDFKDNQSMFTNRGGDISLKKQVKKSQPINCIYATYPVINSFGDLIICCQDYHNKYVFGNIMERPLVDIWFDPYNINLRKRIFKSNFDLEICQKCVM